MQSRRILRILSRRRLSRLAAVLMAAALILGFVPVQAQKTEALTIALLTSAAPDDSEAARQALQGARLAIDVINAAGGVLDPDSPIISPKYFTFGLRERSGATSAEMRTALQASIEDKPVAIVGPDVTAQASGNLDLATSARIPQFIGVAGDPTGAGGTYIFRTRATDDALNRDLANFVIRQRYYAKVATAADDSEAGIAAVEAFETAARAAGVTPDPAVTYSADATDLSAVTQTLYDADPEVVAVFGNARTAALLAGSLKAKGYRGQIVVSAPPADYLTRAGANAEGTILAALWTPAADDVGSQRFAEAYRLRYGMEPGYHAAIAFDSVVLVAGAVKLEGGTPEGVLNGVNAAGAVYGGVQGVYDPAPLTGGRLIESSMFFRVGANGQLSEEARFSANACARGCADTRPRDTNVTIASANEIVRIGFIAPQTGLDGEIGRRALQGAQLAINEINTAGGVLSSTNTRYKFELRSVPASTSEEVRAALQGLAGASASAILGPTLVSPLLANLQIAPTVRIPQLVSASSSALIATDATPFIFMLRAADSVSAGAVGRYVTDIRGLTRVATASATTNYAQDAIGAFNSVVRNVPLTEIVAAVSHPATETDFTNNAKALVAAKPQVIAAFTTPAAAAGLLRALKAEGYTGLFVYGAITNPDFLSQLSPAEAVGVIGAGGWSPSAQDQASRRFVEAYQRTFGELPDSHAAAYYDGVYMLIDALRRGNSAAPATLQSNLSRLTRFAGAAGEYRPAVFGRGQLGQTVFMYEVTADGALREISRWEGVNCINSCN